MRSWETSKPSRRTSHSPFLQDRGKPQAGYLRHETIESQSLWEESRAEDSLFHVFQFLDGPSLIRASCCCRFWRSIIESAPVTICREIISTLPFNGPRFLQTLSHSEIIDYARRDLFRSLPKAARKKIIKNPAFKAETPAATVLPKKSNLLNKLKKAKDAATAIKQKAIQYKEQPEEVTVMRGSFITVTECYSEVGPTRMAYLITSKIGEQSAIVHRTHAECLSFEQKLSGRQWRRTYTLASLESIPFDADSDYMATQKHEMEIFLNSLWADYEVLVSTTFRRFLGLPVLFYPLQTCLHAQFNSFVWKECLGVLIPKKDPETESFPGNLLLGGFFAGAAMTAYIREWKNPSEKAEELLVEEQFFDGLRHNEMLHDVMVEESTVGFIGRKAGQRFVYTAKLRVCGGELVLYRFVAIICVHGNFKVLFKFMARAEDLYEKYLAEFYSFVDSASWGEFRIKERRPKIRTRHVQFQDYQGQTPWIEWIAWPHNVKLPILGTPTLPTDFDDSTGCEALFNHQLPLHLAHLMPNRMAALPACLIHDRQVPPLAGWSTGSGVCGYQGVNASFTLSSVEHGRYL